MALPGDVTIFTLTFGPYTDASGAVVTTKNAKGDPLTAKLHAIDLATGRRLNVTHGATGQVVVPKDLTVTIGSDGTGSIGPLPHTDNPGLSTVGFGYYIEWDIASGSHSYTPGNKRFAVPAASGVTVDFDLLDVAEAVPGVLVPMGVSAGVADAAVSALVEDEDSDTWAALRVALDARLTNVAVTANATATVDKAHRVTAVSRSVTDGAVTAGSTTITSATAAFVSGDVGSFVVGSHIAPLATITAVTNGTTATISHPAALTQTGRSWSIVKPVTVTLPTGAAGDRLTVSKVDAQLATVTIAAPSSGTVNGGASLGLSAPRGTVALTCTAPGAWWATGLVDAIQQGPALFRDFPVVRATDTHVGNLDAQVVGKRAGTGDVGTWEAWHQDIEGNIFHFNCGPGMVGGSGALFGLGCDYQGTGIYLHNRVTGGGGIGLRVGMDQGLTWSGSRGIQVTLGSGQGIGAEFIQSPGSTAPGPVVRFWAQIAADSGQKLVDFHRAKAGDINQGVRVGYVTALTGTLNWDAPVLFTTDAVGSVPLTITGLTGQTADLQQWNVAGTGTVASVTKDGIVQASYLRAQAAGAYVDLYDTAGTANQRRFAIRRVGTALVVTAKLDTNANATSGDILSIDHSTGNITPRDGAGIVAGTTTGLKIGTATTQKLGFFNATPVAKPTGVTVDAAGIHAALVTLGLIAA